MPTTSGTSTSSSINNSKKRKWSRQHLLKNLKILGTLLAPLPPDLPPSPPASRAPSPISGSKRKLNPTSDTENPKRPRTSSASDRSSNIPNHRLHHLPAPTPSQPIRPPNQIHSSRYEPSEDGEVTEDSALASSSSRPPPPTTTLITSSVPVRRPRRGKPSTTHFDQLHEKYHQFGRLLKYSGDARFWSTFPSSNKEYRALPNPPPLNSPYHKFGGLIARLELVDALVCFTYAMWCRDYARGVCQQDTWGTIKSFLSWCRHKWQPEHTLGDREKAFIGLIWMIEAFIYARMFTYATKTIDVDVGKLLIQCKSLAAAAEENPSAPPPGTLISQPTPPMLPSPSSIAPTSANSTPASRANSTPNTSNTSVSSVHIQPSPRPTTPALSSTAAAAGVTVPITPAFAHSLKDQCHGILTAKICMEYSHRKLTLPIIARHFPSTFARMVHSSLLPNEEYEPDIEDEEGELFWPSGCVTGEGLGWVCLMGKAMIQEFGKDYGYRGLEGVVPKPKPEGTGPGTPSEQQPTPPSQSQYRPAGQPSTLQAAVVPTGR